MMVKKLFLLVCFLFSYSSFKAQDFYTINNENLELKTEVNGNLDLLWNIIDNEYRYFIRTSDNTITELINTRDPKDTYQEEYKTILEKATSGMSADKVNLTLPSLITYVETYNKSKDANFTSTHSKSKAQLRLSVFGGLSNSPFVKNPDNIKTPVAGAELEVSEGKESPRHSGFFQIRHVFDNYEFLYSTTELSLGYRLRFVKSKGFNLFADVKAATLNFSKSTVPIASTGGVVTIQEISDTAFDVPFIFGIGADIRITDSSFITIGYNQLFAILVDNQGNFSTDVTLGFKMKL